MTGWKEHKLGDVINLKRGYDLPSQSRMKGSIPIYSSSGITDYHIEAMKKAPGVITGRYGTVGEVFYSDTDYFPLNTTLYVQDFKGNDPKFIYYFLKNFDFEKYSDKSAVPGINRNDVHTEIVQIPAVKEQQTIAALLSSLDDKIYLFHRQNKTLEVLMETLFRKWLAEESDESWEEKGLDEIAEFVNGLACQKYPSVAGKESLPVIKIKDLHVGFTETSDLATIDVPEKYLVNDGDILFSWSGSLELMIWFFGKGILNQHLFKVTSENYPDWFFYFWIKHHLPVFRTIAQDKATTMGHIQRHHLSEAIVLVPSPDEMKLFDKEIKPMFEKIKRNLNQIRTLTQLRNTLLPKLMSGEIKIKQ